MPAFSDLEKEELVRTHLRDPGKRRALIQSLARPTQDLLRQTTDSVDPFHQAVIIVDYMSVLDRLDSTMGPDELREALDGLGGTMTIDGLITGVPLTFENWKGLLRQRLDDLVERCPDVTDLVLVASVMRS